MPLTDPASLPPLPLRTVDPHDDAALDGFMAQTAMLFTADFVHTPQRRDFARDRLSGQRLTGAHDGDRIVGTYRSWDTQVTVPGGGTLLVDAVSSVTVLPTHRRRGVLTSMITADLGDAHARGVPAAVLIASQAPIYGRYGFGAASDAAVWEVDLAAARLAPGVGPGDGTVEIVRPSDLRHLAPAVFDAARSPGEMDRDDFWWDLQCGVTSWPGDPATPRAAVLHRDADGVPQGYAFYTWKEAWPDRQCRTVTSVHDLHAVTPAAYVALWRYFIGLDLVATVRAEDRPVDEPLPALLTDLRAARRTSSADFLWLRLLDPATALTARTYESPGRAVLDVTDPLGHAAGRYLLEVSADGTGKAVRLGAPAPDDGATSDDGPAPDGGPAADDGPAADVRLPVDVLSSLYLGGGDLRAAALAGRVAEHTPGAVARLARLLRTTRQPWTGTWF